MLLALLSPAISAQKDPEAVKVLGEFAGKASAAPSVKMGFDLLVYDAKEEDETTMNGSIVLKGDSYRLNLPDNIIWSDGKNVWNLMPEVNEVTITAADPADESFFSKPSLLFHMHEKGFKVRMLEQDAASWTVDLYPEDIKVNLIRIRVTIGKALHDLKRAEYRTRDGVTVTLTASGYDLSFTPPAGYFVFSTAEHKGVEVIDMR